MKKFILTFILVISFLFISAQNYPTLTTDSCGNKVVTMTIEQAQKIDNNLEILKLLQLETSKCDSLVMAYVVVVDKMGKNIDILEFNVMYLKNQSDSKSKQIKNLQERLNNQEGITKGCEEQRAKSDEIATEYKKKYQKSVLQKTIGFIGNVAEAVVIVYLLIKK